MTIGDIGNSIQQYEFNALYGRHPTIQRVRPNLFCIAYEKAEITAQVETYLISDAGVITTPAQDTLEIPTASGAYNQSCIRPDQNLVLLNSGAAAALYLEAVVVGNDGALSQHANNDCFLTPFSSHYSNPVYQRASIIVLFIRNADDSPYVATNIVSAAGAVTDPLEFSFLIEDIDCSRGQGIRISDGVALFAYHRAYLDIYARPVGIAIDGAISALPQATTQISTVDGPPARWIHLTADWFILSIEGPPLKLTLCAIQCAADGTITVPANNSYQVSDDKGKQPQIIKLSNNMIAIFSTDTSNSAWLTTVQITLGDPVVWSVHDTKSIGIDINNAWGIALVSPAVLALSYSDVDTHGWLWTYEVASEEFIRPEHSLTMGIGP